MASLNPLDRLFAGLSTESSAPGDRVDSGKSAHRAAGVRIFVSVRFLVLGSLAFVILRFTGFNLTAALLGFLVCPAAALMEMVYELITYGHS